MNYIKHLTAIFDVIDKDNRLTPFHISLYMSLFRRWNLNYFQNPITVSRDEIMKMSKIGSVNTYIRCLKDLHFWNYIRYEPSFSRHKGSQVYLYTFDNSTDNGSEIEVRPSLNNKNKSNKENLIGQAQKIEFKNSDMRSIEEKEKLCEKKKNDEISLSGPFPPSLEHIQIYFDEKGISSIEAEKFYNYFESNGWLVGGRARMKDWKAAARNWILNIPKFVAKTKPVNHNSKNIDPKKNYSEPL